VKRSPFLFILLCACASLAKAQDFKLFNRTVQVHGFVSQGFAYSNQNNFLTMNTSQGSGKFTDVGLTMTTQITDKLRMGAQVYDRGIGQLGRWHPNLDWAYLDYKFNHHFGIRVGKIKTALGLYNQTQDAEFLHTWAILPQAIYPLDLRSTNLAHLGGDIYGTFSLHRGGSLAYTLYWGEKNVEKTSGWFYSNLDTGYPVRRIFGPMYGADLNWTTPVRGLTLGESWSWQHDHWDGGPIVAGPLNGLPPEDNGKLWTAITPHKWVSVSYADYQRGKWHFTAEGLRDYEDTGLQRIDNAGPSGTAPGPWSLFPYGYMGWYVSAAYRIDKRLELGAYDSQYQYLGIPSPDHCFDRTIAARIDLNRFWDVKVEGHFMTGDGGAEQGAAHGFYLFDNPALTHTTKLLVVRTGLNF